MTMFLQPRGTYGKQEDEFNKPVESIMRCEDFKSNFARRLSNRYISRSPVSSAKQDTVLKLRPLDNDGDENAPENVPKVSVLSNLQTNSTKVEQNSDVVRPPDKPPFENSQTRKIEVTVLNMEVETLRWQLTQTEANRQMHIALLKQIVAFLNRVKEHIEGQNDQTAFKKGTLPTRLLPRSFNAADLPRTRSVMHVNKNIEYSTTKRISTRKISKSISNVHGLRDSNGVIWSQSKLSLTPEQEVSQKLSEEMTRLITLANTVLSTKIPDLACSSNDKNLQQNSITLSNGTLNNITIDEGTTTILDQIERDALNSIALNTNENGIYSCIHTKNNETPMKERSLSPLQESTLSVICSEENVFSEYSFLKKEDVITNDQTNIMLMADTKSKTSTEKTNEIVSSNFIEDESGFSSMSSFQEIGIPIISIIPPSPSKDIGFMEQIPDIIEDADKWKTDTTELEKQTVKVFWV